MSTENKSLKFIHLGSNVAAKDGSFEAGAIIFEPKSGRIAVQGTTAGPTGLEYYGGGRIADAKFENKKLTLSFNDGSNSIVLDFSDTASASGVNAILGGLNDRITTLETTVNGADGLVKKVNDNASNISANKGEIDANKAAIAAINHETTGILANAKKYADSLAKNYDAAGAAAQALVDAKAYTDTAKGAAIEAAKSYTDTATNALDDRVTTLEGKVSGLETTVGDASSGLVKKVNDNADAIANNADAIAAINHETTGILAQAKSYTDTAKGAAIEAAKSYTDTKVEEINSDAEVLKGRVDTLEGKVGNASNGLVKDVADLSKLHADKTDGTGKMTVKQEAEAAAAAKVAEVVAGAPASYDTLKEIADWIANDTTGAASMANDISKLKTTVGDKDSGLVKGVADNKSSINAHDGRITKLEALHASGTHDGYSTVAEEVKAGIAGIAEHSETNDKVNPKTADVVVTVTTKAGSVSGVAVDAKVLADKVKANADAIATEKSRAEGVEGGLKTSLDDIRGDLGQTTDASTVTTTAFGRIKALEEKQSSGTLMWSRWD